MQNQAFTYKEYATLIKSMVEWVGATTCHQEADEGIFTSIFIQNVS
jgi:hypothetical protein